jgi:hypothetical protein
MRYVSSDNAFTIFNDNRAATVGSTFESPVQSFSFQAEAPRHRGQHKLPAEALRRLNL